MVYGLKSISYCIEVIALMMEGVQLLPHWNERSNVHD